MRASSDLRRRSPYSMSAQVTGQLLRSASLLFCIREVLPRFTVTVPFTGRCVVMWSAEGAEIALEARSSTPLSRKGRVGL
jgi:hypothetical protein